MVEIREMGHDTASGQPIDVLLADDDEDIRDALVETLQYAGYTTVAFSNGRDALEWLQETKSLPSLLLIDMTMPILDGVQFCQEQLIDPKICDIPVAIFSAHNDILRNLGVEYLHKPVNADTLVAFVARHCGARALKTISVAPGSARLLDDPGRFADHFGEMIPTPQIPLLATLGKATFGLLFPSESDAPLSPYCFRGAPGEEPTPAALLAAEGLPSSTPVETITLAELFDPFAVAEESASPEDRAEANRYHDLASLLSRELTNVRVYRVGKVDIDVYVLGQTPQGAWAGLKTHVVET